MFIGTGEQKRVLPKLDKYLFEKAFPTDGDDAFPERLLTFEE